MRTLLLPAVLVLLSASFPGWVLAGEPSYLDRTLTEWAAMAAGNPWEPLGKDAIPTLTNFLNAHQVVRLSAIHQ